MLENWEKIKEYYEAWWSCEVLDKIPIWVAAPGDGPKSREILSGNTIKIKREERFNQEKVIGCAEKIFRATFFGGVAFPCYWPNFGTDVYEESYKITAAKQEGSSSWVNLWFPGKGYPVQNDFTALISTSMYQEFFLEELINEINYLDYSIYHLDGPDALKRLDTILEIPRLNAVQWVPGAGMMKEGVTRWIPIYRKIQAKKKAIQVFCRPDEVDFVLDNLKLEGLLIFTTCCSEKEAKELLSHTGWT